MILLKKDLFVIKIDFKKFFNKNFKPNLQLSLLYHYFQFFKIKFGFIKIKFHYILTIFHFL